MGLRQLTLLFHCELLLICIHLELAEPAAKVVVILKQVHLISSLRNAIQNSSFTVAFAVE